MPKISNFVYCMSSTAIEMESNIYGVVNSITPEYVPGEFSFSVFCSVLGLDEGAHKINMQFISPSGEKVIDLDGMVSNDRPENFDIPKEYSGLNISSNWQNVVLKEAGLYKTEVFIDGEQLGSYEIYVKGKNQAENK